MSQFELRTVPVAETRPLRQRVLRPHQEVEELAGHEPTGSVAFGVFAGSELVAVGLIGPEGEPGDWRVRGMAAAPHVRGRGAGSQILRALVTHASAHGATRVWCHARTPALALYTRLGFVPVSDEFEVTHTGPHYRMELALTG